MLPLPREVKPETILKQAQAWSRKYTDLWPSGSENRTGAARVLLEWALQNAVQSGVDVEGIWADFSANPFVAQQHNLRTEIACREEEEVESAIAADSILANLGIGFPFWEEQYQKIPTLPEATTCEAREETWTAPRLEQPLSQSTDSFGVGLDKFVAKTFDPKRTRNARQIEAYQAALSLADVEAVNATPPKGTGAWVQYHACPKCGEGNDRHKGRFNVNTETGGYNCKACGVKGKLREFWDNPPIQSDDTVAPSLTPEELEAKRHAQAERDAIQRAEQIEKAQQRYSEALPLSDEAAEYGEETGWDYLQRRTGAAELADRLGVRVNDDSQRKAVLVPFRNEQGDLVGVNDRRIDQSTYAKSLTTGRISEGVFATPGAFTAEQVVIVESGLKAIPLAACGFEVIAVGGTSWPEWLPAALEGKFVLSGFDNDPVNSQGVRPGDEAHKRLVKAINGRACVTRFIPPFNCKDWNEVVEQYGLEVLRDAVASVLLEHK